MMSNLFLLVLLIVINNFIAQPEGWKMTDRFYGFRYELHGSELDKGVLESIVKEADNYACFGWTQISPSGTIVGEVRCSKARGKIFQDKLKVISPKVARSDILVYEDTKIRLHFSTFKILPTERETCFLDSPHQCKEFSNRGSPSLAPSTMSDGSKRADEL